MTKSEATTRLTNDNEPMRVDKKVWTSAYTSPAVTNEVPNVNGTPKTDPEVRLIILIKNHQTKSLYIRIYNSHRDKCIIMAKTSKHVVSLRSVVWICVDLVLTQQ